MRRSRYGTSVPGAGAVHHIIGDQSASQQNSYSITSSAIPSSDGSTVTLSALAVLRLIVSLNLVGAWTGTTGPGSARRSSNLTLHLNHLLHRDHVVIEMSHN